MNTKQIAKWLAKNKRKFPIISLECTISQPTLYEIVKYPEAPRQQRIIDALTKYIEQQKVAEDGKQ